MSAVYILLPDQTQAAYESDDIPGLLAAGTLTPETYYWQEGMAEWCPLSGFSPAAASTPAPITYIGTATSWTLPNNLEPVTTIVKVMLGLYLAATLALLYSAFDQIQFVYITHVDLEAARAHDSIMVLIAHTSLGLYVLTSIPFLTWIYRTNANCHAVARGLKHSPASATFSYFLPIINLAVPCAAMQEIWKASTNPQHWEETKGSVLIGIWWAFWLAACIIGTALIAMPKVQDRSTLWNTTAVLIALELVKVVLTILAFTMIHQIAARQKRLAAVGVVPA